MLLTDLHYETQTCKVKLSSDAKWRQTLHICTFSSASVESVGLKNSGQFDVLNDVKMLTHVVICKYLNITFQYRPIEYSKININEVKNFSSIKNELEAICNGNAP